MATRHWALGGFVISLAAACQEYRYIGGSDGEGDDGGGGAQGEGEGAQGQGAQGQGAGTSGPSSTSSGNPTGPTGGSNEPGALLGITEAHNVARRNVSPAPSEPLPDLIWDPAIASVAQSYADQCVFEHSGNGYGENLYANSGSATANDVVNGWVSEVADYDYGSNSCSGVCGHYTQVVWASTRKLGCGVANCSAASSPFGTEWQNWVCNYDPPGNYIGESPY